MVYRWFEEEERDPQVKQASELAEKARECYRKAENLKGTAAADELKKAIGYIKQIDRIFDVKSEDYCASFFAYHRAHEAGLNIAVYYKAAYVALDLKRYKEAYGYAEIGDILARRAEREDDTLYINEFKVLKEMIREAEWNDSPAGLAAAKAKSLNEKLNNLSYVAGIGFVVLLILTSILGIFFGIKMIDAPIFLCVLYCVIGMMLGYWVSFEHITGGYFVDRLVPYLFFGGSIIVVMLLQFLRVNSSYGDSIQIGTLVAPVIVKEVFNIVGLVAGLKYNRNLKKKRK